MKSDQILILRKIWRVLPEGVRRIAWKMGGRSFRGSVSRRMIARPRGSMDWEHERPLVVVGLFRTANGIGAAARSTYHSLVAAGLKPIAVDLSEELASVDLDPGIPLQSLPDSREGVLILQLNAPETIAALRFLSMTIERSWYVIGYWAWELPSFPKEWDQAFPFLSEIWTISEFTAKALRSNPLAPKITVFHHSISVPETLERSPQLLPFDEDCFVFLVMADAMSSLERKNPFSVIKAFKAAFKPSEKVGLVIKTRNIEKHEEARAQLLKEIEGHANIKFIDQTLSDQEKWNLYNSVDCFVSLHRAEGFGLVMAEFMALGKPVIATAWSGNMDFMTPQNSYLVPAKMIRCVDQFNVYNNRKTVWADPDIEQAAKCMKSVVSDGGLRQTTSTAAASHINLELNPVTIGTRMKQYLYDVKEQNKPA